jgi:hypothetical protein
VPCITRADAYVRRQPERSVLYQTVAKHWPAFREMLEQAGGLPRYRGARIRRALKPVQPELFDAH